MLFIPYYPVSVRRKRGIRIIVSYFLLKSYPETVSLEIPGHDFV
jgi:hypothetical protein